uniref:Uncharacterized protein n=1 Tax=Sphaerodactylus townsendi TaxID=933632 RepID=A0ACB8G8A1_9SAUR
MGTIILNRTVPGTGSQLRPDTVIRDEEGKKIILVDITIPILRNLEDLSQRSAERVGKCTSAKALPPPGVFDQNDIREARHPDDLPPLPHVEPGDPMGPSNGRPISLCSTIHKMYTSCLAAHITDWAIVGELFSRKASYLVKAAMSTTLS